MKNIFLILLLFFSCRLFGQPYVVHQLGIKEGLSNNHVVSIAQDKQGFLWFATEEGLNKFDGTHFTTYYKKEAGNKQSITGNELNSLLDDPRDSILWIATQRAGLNACHYMHNTFSSYKHDENDPESLITDDITKIVPAENGNLWVCTYWKGIDYLDKQTGKFSHYNTENVQGLPSNHIWSVVDGENGMLYVGHVDHGFSIISIKERTAKNFVHHPHDNSSLPGNEVTCIYKDEGGNIWVGTDNGIALFNPESECFVRIDNRQKDLAHRIYDIREIDKQKLWIAMEFGGIAILDLSQHLYHPFDEHHLQFLREGDNEYGLSNASVRCLLKDSFGNVWAGSWGGGINFIPNHTPLFNTYKYSPIPVTANSLSSKIAAGICFDKEGKLWIGTNQGDINVFEAGKRTAVYNMGDNRQNGTTIQGAFCDSRGGLWFGLFYGGISYYDAATKSFRQILPEDKSHTDVRSFFEDNQGNIWTATSEGVYVIDREKKSILQHFGLENNLVRCILKDAGGQVWVGFFGGGLGLYDTDMNLIKLFLVQDGFPSNTINALYEDSRKQLWVATGEGLVCFSTPSKPEYRVYRRENGLANTHIHAIGEDKAGNLWFSTNKGISCLTNEEVVYNYDHRDNLPMGSYSRGSIAQSDDGTFYFGSIDGLCYFNPEEVLQNRHSPLAIITHVEIAEPQYKPENNRNTVELNGQKNLRLEYTQNSFSIQFNVQNYAFNHEVEYAYMMKGLENAWYTLPNSNNVTFRNLSPGNYRFLVKTRMRNQAWSNEASMLDIRISPPVWLTWWAKLLYTLAIAGVLAYIIYAYKKRLKAEALYKLEKQSHEHEQDLNNERLRFYTNITHELRTPLTLIVGPLEDLQKSDSLSTKDAQKISVIRQSALRLLNLINQILEFRKTETQNRQLCVSRNDLTTLIRENGLKYKELNRKKEIEIRWEIEPHQAMLYFDREIIQIVLDNLISNALKYTDKGSITIGLHSIRQDMLNYTEISVCDTGYGISPEAIPHIFDRYYQEGGRHQASGTGIGLALVKNLVELHEGEIDVESTPNFGSTFRVRLLTDNSYPNALHAETTEKKQLSPLESKDVEHETNGNKPILLVVEDNPDIREYVAGSFSDSFDVRTADNGKQGMELALKDIPDIIVSDIMMPVMDGNEMCRALKKDVRTSHIPIILLTAKDSLTDKEEGYQTGADSYLTKPFSASLLHSRIGNLLQSRKQLAEHFSSHSVTNDKSAIMAESMSKLDNEFIQKIDQLIKERLSTDKIEIGYLADKMCMSNSTLYRKMKALTGLSTNEYIRKARMKYAEQYLLEGKYSISEIAFKVGINNLFYFRQCFKEEFGCIPSEYLKKLKNEL